jgi:hypothetical protein
MHSTMRAALICQHATDERAREIAARLSQVVENQVKDDGDDGAVGERTPAT